MCGSHSCIAGTETVHKRRMDNSKALVHMLAIEIRAADIMVVYHMVPMVHVYHGTRVPFFWYVHVYVRTYVRTYNVMSQLSDWKRAHMCHMRTENHVCVLGGYTAAS